MPSIIIDKAKRYIVKPNSYGKHISLTKDELNRQLDRLYTRDMCSINEKDGYTLKGGVD